MSNKPKATIKNFSGMGQGTYYLDKMESQKIGGEDVLTPGWYTTNQVNESDTLFSDLNVIQSFNYITYGSGVLDNHVLAYGSSGRIFDFNSFVLSYSLGLIHTISNAGSGTDRIFYVNSPDVTTTTNNNILYTSADHMGRGSVGEATGGSTTTLIDTTVNFTTDLGITTSAGSNKVYNVTNKEEYTVTSITTTTNTNDTINFSTAGTAAADGDVYIAFQDDYQKYETTFSTNNHFTGQVSVTSWVRQIKLLGDEYWSLNGNYLSSLNIDESTWAAEAKRLPYQTQAVCFDENDGKLLVGGGYQGQGKLMLWDTVSDGWNSILDLDMPPDAIKSYGSGWIVMAHNKIYYTDGYQIKIMSTVPDMDNFRQLFNAHYNGIEIIGDNIIISASPNRYNRGKTGIWIYNVKKGWSFTSNSNDNGQVYTGNVGAVSKIYPWTTPSLYTSAYDDAGTNNYLINNIYQGSGTKYSAMFYVKLPEKMKINSIELNLSSTYNDFADSDSTVDVSVSYGDGKDTLWDYAQVKTGSTASSIINANGAAYPASVGQEVLMLEGDTGGEKTWITAITNPSTSSETWAVSPSLSAIPETNADVCVVNINLAETKTVNSNAIPDNLTYNVSDFYSDKLWIEVDFEVKTGTYTLDLHSINIR